MLSRLLRFALAAGLLLLPSCFLPQWDDRDWVDDDDATSDDDDTGDDDDTSDDDDDTGDDDDATTGDVEFTGQADIYLSVYRYPGQCQAPMEGEYDAAQAEIDGEGECLFWGYVNLAIELDCDVVGTTVDGTALVYDDDGYINVPLSIPVDGSYNQADGTVLVSGSTMFSGVYGEVTINLTAI